MKMWPLSSVCLSGFGLNETVLGSSCDSDNGGRYLYYSIIFNSAQAISCCMENQPYTRED